MDGTTYVGTAEYPGGDIDEGTLVEHLEALAEGEPFRALTWDRPLPAYTG
jgi:hypothetical protein